MLAAAGILILGRAAKESEYDVPNMDKRRARFRVIKGCGKTADDGDAHAAHAHADSESSNVEPFPYDPTTTAGMRQLWADIRILMEAFARDQRERLEAVSRQTAAAEVLVDLVDDNAAVVGQEKLSVVYRDRVRNYRSYNLFIENSRSQVLTLRRSCSRLFFPDCLDITLSSHLLAGEDYHEALGRGLWEELGLQLSYLECRELGMLTPNSDDSASFLKVFHMRLDVTPAIRARLHSGTSWMTPIELLEELDGQTQVQPDLGMLLSRFFE